MTKTYHAPQIIKLSTLDADSVLALATTLLDASKKESNLTGPITDALKRIHRTQAALAATASARKSNEETAQHHRDASREQAAAWSALHQWANGWAELGREGEKAEAASSILTTLFDDGLRFLNLRSTAQWAAADRRLQLLGGRRLDSAVKVLGGQAFVDRLRASHKLYGDALGVTGSRIETRRLPLRRTSVDELIAALRRYVVQVSLHADRDADAASQADRLLEPLINWRAP